MFPVTFLIADALDT
jgi:di/tricarboxylate transporter